MALYVTLWMMQTPDTQTKTKAMFSTCMIKTAPLPGRQTEKKKTKTQTKTKHEGQLQNHTLKSSF